MTINFRDSAIISKSATAFSKIHELAKTLQKLAEEKKGFDIPASVTGDYLLEIIKDPMITMGLLDEEDFKVNNK